MDGFHAALVPFWYFAVKGVVIGLVRDGPQARGYRTNMVTTRIRKGARPHLYIEEHMAAKELSDEKVANRLGVARETVTRWRGQQHRLNPDKIAALADALNVEPEDLWRPPHRPSLDAIAKEFPDDLQQKAAEIVRLLGRTGT